MKKLFEYNKKGYDYCDKCDEEVTPDEDGYYKCECGFEYQGEPDPDDAAYGREQDEEQDAWAREAGLQESVQGTINRFLKESDLHIPTPTPVSKRELTGNDLAIKELLEKSYKAFEIQNITSQGNSYIITLKTKVSEEFIKDPELKRYMFSKQLQTFRQDLFADLSMELSVIGVRIGSYQFVKGKEDVIFDITILLSETEIKDWVSGKFRKDLKDE